MSNFAFCVNNFGILNYVLTRRQCLYKLFYDFLDISCSYQTAVSMLSNTEMLAPAYFIVGGTKSGEACIITRSREKTLDTWK